MAAASSVGQDQVTEYFIHQLPDWFARARDSRCAEASKTQPPSFVLVTLAVKNREGQKGPLLFYNNCTV
jgi:hypothetical protein